MSPRFQPHPELKRIPSRYGWTLVEMLVAVAAGSIILAALVSTVTFVSKSFIAMGNYADLDRASRIALDTMSRDIRNAAGLVSYATNSITLANQDGSQFSYTWDPSSTRFTRITSSNSTVLLTNCNSLFFYIYQRNPTNYFQFYSATNAPGQTKLVNVSWRCSRKILSAITNSESVQTAEIVIRN